eukprot:g1671.t1
MVLPGTPTLVDMVLYAANPLLQETLMQSKESVTASIVENRKEAGSGKMRWRDATRLSGPVPEFKGKSFLPCFGKLDLYQAYLQMAVRNPNRNYFQVYNPSTKKFEFGKLSALSFGNVHSVFGFVGSISELLNHLINDILGIPATVYVDDIIFMCTEELGPIYMKAIREMLALIGIAVEPNKCEVAKIGEPIELLGVDFTTFENRIEVKLTEKKIEAVNKKVKEAWGYLNRLEHDAAKVTQDDLRDFFHLLEELNGLFIHCTFWRNIKKGIPLTGHIYNLVSSFGKFCSLIKSYKCFKMIKALTKKMSEEVNSRIPMVIRKDVAVRGKLHVMTDASSSEKEGGKVAFGGLIFFPDGTSKGFSLHLKQKQLPPVLRRRTILVYELVALYMAQIIYADDLKSYNALMHCDNAGATYGVVKGRLRCPIATAVVASITSFNLRNDVFNFYAYINTDDNVSDACTRVEMLEELARSYNTIFPYDDEYIRSVLVRVADDMATNMSDLYLGFDPQ